MIKPLEGKILISTRPEYSEDKIGQALRKEGATVVQLPMIAITENNVRENEQELLNLDDYTRVIFTSQNGVKHFFEQFNQLHGHTKTPGHLKYAVYGSRTFMTLEKYGKNADIASFGNTSKDLLEVLKTKCTTEDHLLLAMGNLATDLLAEGLDSTCKTKRINVYKTIENRHFQKDQKARILEDRYDLILFTSPSGFISFKNYFEDKIELEKVKMACIGETTEKAVLAAGLQPQVVASEPGAYGMTKSILEYFAK